VHSLLFAQPSFRDLVDTIYEDLFAYTTIKVVKTKDWRLSAMKRMFNAGVGVYVLFTVVFYHGFLYKEIPVVTVSTDVNGDSLNAELQNLSYTFSNGGYPPQYCGATRTNATNTTASMPTTVSA
jgi:hypothetical protein